MNFAIVNYRKKRRSIEVFEKKTTAEEYIATKANPKAVYT